MRKSLIIQQGAGAFQGIAPGIDPEDLPQGRFAGGQNMICSADRFGEARTRDGFAPVHTGRYSKAFKIMPGARGLLYQPPRLNEAEEDGSGYALTIGAAPNKDLFISESHLTQTVTFYVYGGDLLGISEYSWTFGDGGSTSGSSTSVSHDYTAAGARRVTVSGTGTDGHSYSASLDITIENRDETGNTVTASITANGKGDSLTITEDGPVTIAWRCTNAETCTLNIATQGAGSTANEVVSATGSRSVPVVGGLYASIDAASELGDVASDTVMVEVRPEEPPEDLTAILAAVVDGVVQEDHVTLSAQGDLNIVWSTTGAETVTLAKSGEGLSGESLTVDPEGSATVAILGTSLITLTATDAEGATVTDTLSVAVEDAVQDEEKAAEIRLIVPATIETGTAFTPRVEIWGRLTATDPLRLWPVASLDVQVGHVSDVGVSSGSYIETVTITDAASADCPALTPVLATGLSTGSLTLGAYITTAPTIQTQQTVAVTRAAWDIFVEVLDGSGAAITEAFVLTEDGTDILLRVTARFAGTTEPDPAFAESVRLNIAVTEHQPGVWPNPQYTLQGYTVGPIASLPGDFNFMADGVIPPAAFVGGQTTVLLTAQMAFLTPGYPNYLLYHDWSITGRVV